MQSKSWIYDFDKLTFEPYTQGASLGRMKTHTTHGELIIHLDNQGMLWFVKDEGAEVWEEDEVIEVDGLTWGRDVFTN